jgi:GNAT superfamily N-acetyltransferase
MIAYRQATLKDKKHILAFYKKAYPGDHIIRSSEQWDWQYENNPFTNKKLGIWLAEDESTNTIVGHTGVISEHILIGDKSYSVGWGIDLIVLPEFRGRGIAVGLQQEMIRYVDFYMNISMSETTRIVSAKLGAFETQEIVQYVKPLFVPPERVIHYLLLKTYANGTLVKKMTRFLLKKRGLKQAMKYLKINNVLSSSISKKIEKQDEPYTCDYEITELKDSGSLAYIDEIWKGAEGLFDKIVIRDKTYFKWKYFDQPFKKHHVYIAQKENRALGYMVLREGAEKEPHVGVIVDYLYTKDQISVFNDLLHFAMNYFVSRNKEFIYINTTDQKSLDYLRLNSFKKTRVHRPSFLTQKKDLGAYVKNNPDGWFLTFTDHELDRYPMRGK